MSSVLVRRSVVALRSSRFVACRFSHTLKGKEGATEKQYFNEEDEKLMRKLLGKLKTQVSTENPAAKSVERQRLDAIVDKYKVSDADKEALLTWRHSAEF